MITPWKCSECGVCVAACSNGGLDGLKLRQLTSLGPVSVYKCTKTLCKECGKPIAPNCADGLCSVCRIKLRTKKRQEEAVARAKERQAEREAKKAAEAAAKRRCPGSRSRSRPDRKHLLIAEPLRRFAPAPLVGEPSFLLLACLSYQERWQCEALTERFLLTQPQNNAIILLNHPAVVGRTSYKGVTDVFPLRFFASRCGETVGLSALGGNQTSTRRKEGISL